jgi:hypothetical protein
MADFPNVPDLRQRSMTGLRVWAEMRPMPRQRVSPSLYLAVVIEIVSFRTERWKVCTAITFPEKMLHHK